MNYINITKAQAEEIAGGYGTRRSDGSYPARIEPVAVPDGTFIFPESCLTGFGLESVKTKLESLVKSDNVQELVELPKFGEPCEKDRIYIYNEQEENGYHGLVKCVQTHNRTIYSPQETPALFSFFRENSDDLEWIPNEIVELGWKRIYEGVQYEVIQPHMTLAGWEPPNTPALWIEVQEEGGDIPVWVRPTGAHDCYNIGDQVHFPTADDPVYESVINGNVWSPTEYGAGWRLV